MKLPALRASVTLTALFATTAIFPLVAAAANVESTSLTTGPRATTVDVNFAGGTVAEFVAQLKNSDGSGFNLMGDPVLLQTPVPKTIFYRVEPSAVTAALNAFLRTAGLSISLTSPNILVLIKTPVYAPSFSSPLPNFQAFQLSSYLQTLAVDDVTDAISTAWKADPKHEPSAVTFKFHPATKVLFVYGPAEAITMATLIVPQLNPNATVPSTRDFIASRTAINPPDPASEQARLEAVAQEVRRRRDLRDAAAAAGKAPDKK